MQIYRNFKKLIFVMSSSIFLNHVAYMGYFNILKRVIFVTSNWSLKQIPFL